MLPSEVVIFPKLVVHAALAGLYGGFVVVLLLRLANPTAGDGAWPVTTGLFVVLAYTFLAAVLWPVLYVTLRFFASHRLRLTWFSLRYLIGFNVVNTAVLLGAGWLMLSENRSSLSPQDAHRLANGCGWLTLAWLAGVVAAIAPGLRRRSHVQAAAGVLALAALLVNFPGADTTRAGTLVAAGVRSETGTAVPSPPPGTSPARRVVLLNFDGADLDTILTLQAQGKLPSFSRLVAEGSYGRLSTLEPCVAAVTRATLITGMLPYRNGVRGPQARSVLGRSPWLEVVPEAIGFDNLLAPVLVRRSTSVADRRAPALWEISARLGGVGEAAGWEVDLDDSGKAGTSVAPDPPQEWLAELLDPEVLHLDDPRTRALVQEIVRAAKADAEALEALFRFEAHEGHGVTAVSFPGLDRVAHVFLRYARPADFGNVPPGEIDHFGAVLERYYRRVDGIVGRVMQRGGAETLLLITSTHGIVPAPPLRRLKEEILGGEHLSGVHQDAPAGFLFVHGPQARRAKVFGKGSIADVAPTALYGLGLPVARNADGSILAGAFSEAFTLSHPVTVIGSYDLRAD